MFYRCSIHCTHCEEVIASTMTQGRHIPLRVLRRMATSEGAKTDRAGRWYCGPSCRTAFRLKHDTSNKETPHV